MGSREKKKNEENVKQINKKVVIPAVLITLVVVLCAVVFAIANMSGREKEDTVGIYFEALSEKDIQKFSDACFSNRMMAAYCSMLNADQDTVLSSILSGLQKETVEFGEFEIIEEKARQVNEIDELREQMGKDTGVDVAISEMCDVKVSVQMKEDAEWEEKEIVLTLYKNGRTWYVYPN